MIWRRYHRWLSVLFGLLILWVAVTGVLSQIGDLVNHGGFEADGDERPAAATTAPPGFVCPPSMSCRPKPAPRSGEWNVGFLHRIHSGEQFGPAGTILFILSGVALIFFALSGMWMYVQMFTARGRNSVARGEKNRLFW